MPWVFTIAWFDTEKQCEEYKGSCLLKAGTKKAIIEQINVIENLVEKHFVEKYNLDKETFKDDVCPVENKLKKIKVKI